MSIRKQVRIGIVGMGVRGRGWIRTCRRVKGCKVTALCEKVEPLLQEGYKEAEDPKIKCYTDFDEMLKEAKIDAIATVTAPHDQPDLICKALEAGKHVTCEVSLTYNMKDLWRVVVAVEKSGLKFHMAEQIMYSAFVPAWKRLFLEGRLGKIIFAEGQYLHQMMPDRFYIDSKTGGKITIEQAKNNPKAKKSRVWYWLPHPILYLATDLGPILTILDDRVESVTCMATRKKSYHYPGIPASDIEVALMHTEKDTIIRMASGFTYSTPSYPQSHHWWHLEGTEGKVETARSVHDKAKMWLANSYMDDAIPINWQYPPYDFPPEAIGSGHGDLDYFAVASFIKSIQEDSEPPLNVYKSADLTAPAIIAIQSVEQGSSCLKVPDFRPSDKRKSGEFPEKI